MYVLIRPHKHVYLLGLVHEQGFYSCCSYRHVLTPKDRVEYKYYLYIERCLTPLMLTIHFAAQDHLESSTCIHKSSNLMHR